MEVSLFVSVDEEYPVFRVSHERTFAADHEITVSSPDWRRYQRIEKEYWEAQQELRAMMYDAGYYIG